MDFMLYYALILSIFLFIFTVLFLSIYKKTQERAIGFWGASWGLYGAGVLLQVLLIDAMEASYLLTLQQIIFSVSGLLLLAGTYHLNRKSIPRFWTWIFLANLIWILLGLNLDLNYFIKVLPLSLFYSVVAVYTGIEFLQEWPIEGREKTITGIIFIIWGIHKSYYFYLNPTFNSSSTHYILELILILALNVAIFFLFLQKNHQTLKRNEKIFRLLTENAQDIIYLYNTKPDPSFEYISPNVTKILGYPQRSFYENPYLLLECVHPDDKALFDLSMTPNLSPEASVTLRYKTNFGEYRWFQEYTTLIHDSSGEPFGIEGRMQDITDNKRYSDEKNRSAKERQKLLYVISHELKTPITTLRGNLEAILDDKLSGDKERLLDSISSAYQKTRLLERLVSDLFELAQFESSQFTFNFSLLSFNESFLPIFQKFAHDAEQAGYSFILNLSEELKKENPEFILDLERIDQVMYNLVNNAMKNTKKGGTITVDCGMLGSGSISIRIQDSGHGISEQDLPYIFDMFYTSQSTGGSRGTGLGLAITKEILIRHHGEISVESEVNEGTAFLIRFPIALVDQV
jgi:PAS domain S-box-containing protein